MSSTEIELQWLPAEGATGYAIDRRLTNSLTWITTNIGPGSLYKFTGLTPASSYEFRLRAKCNAVQSASTPTVTASTLAQTGAFGQAQLTAYDIDGVAWLVWSAPTINLSYRLLRSESSQGPFSEILLTAATKASDSTVLVDHTYFYRVAASDGTFSSESNTVPITIRQGDAMRPSARPILSADGYLYGASSLGGVSGLGTFYRMSLDGTSRTSLSFSLSGEAGYMPSTLSLLNQDWYIGTIRGSVKNRGAILKMPPDMAPVIYPTLPSSSSLISWNNVSYGTTRVGGAYGQGSVFSVNASGTITVLYSFLPLEEGFSENDLGAKPAGAVCRHSDGYFYGIAEAGGLSGTGTIYRFDANTSTVTLSYTFPDLDDPASQQLRSPGTSLVSRDGVLYFTTSEGGANNSGALFKFDPALGTVTAVFSFPALDSDSTNSQGAIPTAGLTLAADGFIYGTTESGGLYGCGVLYRLGAGGAVQVLHHFDLFDGSAPNPGLTITTSGSIIGTCASGGLFGKGVVFELSASGVFRTIRHFGGFIR